MKILLLHIILLLGINVSHSIDIDKWEKDALYLASDKLMGRGTGQIGGQLAADFLANRFGEIKLDSFGVLASYQQEIDFAECSVDIQSSIDILLNNVMFEAKYQKDFLMSGKCNLPELIQSEVVFLGFGLMADRYGWDDYKSKDVEGKTVIILEGKPQSLDLDLYEYHISSKTSLAYSLGASSVILVPLIEDLSQWITMEEELSPPSMKLNYSKYDNVANKDMYIWNPFSLGKLGISLKQYAFYHSQDYTSGVLEGEKSLQALNETSSIKITTRLVTKEGIFKDRNIVGVLHPKGNSSDYIVLSAHYDHLGIDTNLIGDQIYNGFYDNAMGVASLLSIAENLSKGWFERQNTRGVIFLLTTGEEKGLLGSRYFTDNLPVPYDKVIANVNIDGIAAFGEPNGYYVLGGEYSWLGQYADNVLFDNGKYKDEIDDIYGKDDFFRYSDQFAFAIAGIPSIQIVDGLDYVGQSRSNIARKAIYYSQNFYHTPHDEPIIGYRLNGVESHTTLILDYVRDILETDKNISWLKNSPYHRKLQESLTFD